MKQFIDKLISRLEEKIKEKTNDDMSYKIPYFGLEIALNIVNELAEEYKGKANDEWKIIYDNVCNLEKEYATKGNMESVNDCIRLENLLQYFKEELRSTEKYNGGWIPCEVRLPEEDGKRYIVQKTNGFIDILGFTKNAYKLSRYDFAEYKGKEKLLFYDYDSEYGYTEWECEAWMPLPAPYKEGGAE